MGAQFLAAMGQNMDAVSQAFGAGFDAVLNHISAYRAGHLVGGVDIFAQVIDQLINSYPTDLVDQLKAAVGDDVMSRLRTAYFAGRSVVDSSEIQQLAAAVVPSKDLQAQHTIITALKAEFAANMDAVKAAFGPGFDTMESIIVQYRTNQ